MEPRLAPALATLRDQVNAAFPTRSKASDGWIASDEHLNRTGAGAAASQHNPNRRGVVCAIDVTEDLAVGLDCMQLLDELDAGNDPRFWYGIHDGQIENSDDTRTPYTGSSRHDKHLHISTRYDEAAIYEDGRPWAVPMLTPQEDDMPTPEEFADAVLDRKLDAVEYAHGKTIGPARTHTYIRHAAAHATKSSVGTAAILALLKSWSGEQLDVRGLARELVPLLAPALLAKGLTRDDVEEVFREVLGGLDEEA